MFCLQSVDLFEVVPNKAEKIFLTYQHKPKAYVVISTRVFWF